MRGLILAILIGCGPKDAPIEAAACPTALQSLPASPQDASAQASQGKTWTNQEIRVEYVCRAASIGALNEGWKSEGLDAETRALKAWEVRHNARVTSRAMMADADEVAALEARDLAKYGHKDGPTFEWLVEKGEAEGLSGDALYESIIASSQVTNAEVNKAMGL